MSAASLVSKLWLIKHIQSYIGVRDKIQILETKEKNMNAKELTVGIDYVENRIMSIVRLAILFFQLFFYFCSA